MRMATMRGNDSRQDRTGQGREWRKVRTRRRMVRAAKARRAESWSESAAASGLTCDVRQRRRRRRRQREGGSGRSSTVLAASDESAATPLHHIDTQDTEGQERSVPVTKASAAESS